jgi:ADP-ribose pyrophosphatase
METWKLVSERPGPVGYLKVSTRTYAMPDDREADWDILDGGRTVAVVAITTDNDALLTRQFRPGPGKVMLELAGGLVEEHEDVLDAAARELREETGYVADHMTLVGQTSLASYATHLRHAVLATGCRPLAEQRLDEDEFCEVVTMPMRDLLAHVRTGDLTDVDAAWMCLDRLNPWSPSRANDSAF